MLELNEHTRASSYDALLAALDRLRRRGLRIAVDDTGAGYAGFQHLLQLGPHILKLDTTLSRGIDADPVRRALPVAGSTPLAGNVGNPCAEARRLSGCQSWMRRPGRYTNHQGLPTVHWAHGNDHAR